MKIFGSNSKVIDWEVAYNPPPGAVETVVLSGKIYSYHIWCGVFGGCEVYGIRCMLG
jgi:hypothetical protein